LIDEGFAPAVIKGISADSREAKWTEGRKVVRHGLQEKEN
tara:strand:+ start:683 stop:802 length:120 start_codon:yes stop_codon:yes gene_type:complete